MSPKKAQHRQKSEEQQLDFRTRPLEILVGASRTAFYIHESLICGSSEFFKNAMNRDWKESQERSVPLPDDDVEIFDLYSKWLYTGTITYVADEASIKEAIAEQDLKDFKSPSKLDEIEDKVSAIYVQLAKAIVMGEKLQDVKFKDAITDTITDCISNFTLPSMPGFHFNPGYEFVNIIYAGTMESAPIRRLLVEIWVNQASKTWLLPSSTASEKLPNDFYYDLSAGLLEGRVVLFKDETAFRKRKQTCCWHSHGAEAPCSKRQKET
ncbi:hypothetical protein K402DRAFT_465431 [Aulographum hederae CBS 113979]|uniref:BTB domain-containing protein n=1 Tax=Aulographum hederae CBS 113979 TaxID=1176131 RepID=A0A6G1GTC8_9PEZI|nr:hypothetical protein K402DRAFT_465431 [Aulographum hederae CBS 113979]